MQQLTTIKSYLTPIEATMMKQLLDAEGIFCFLKDEHLVTTAPFFANISGGIKLQVRDEEAERAIGLLVNAGYLREHVKSEVTKRKENRMLIVLLAIVFIVLLVFALIGHI